MRTGRPARRPLVGLVASLGIVALVAACAAPGAGTSNPPAATNGAMSSAPSTPPESMGMAGLHLELATVPTHGSVVVGEGGRSVYLFTNDSGGSSACVDDCAATWPPVTVASAADVVAGTGVTGAIGTIERADGTTQVTLGGAPLYYFAADGAAGDTMGQGIGGVWYLVSAAGEAVGQAGASPAGGGQPTSTACTGRSCY